MQFDLSPLLLFVVAPEANTLSNLFFCLAKKISWQKRFLLSEPTMLKVLLE
jgi:hypothetical protein